MHRRRLVVDRHRHHFAVDSISVERLHLHLVLAVVGKDVSQHRGGRVDYLDGCAVLPIEPPLRDLIAPGRAWVGGTQREGVSVTWKTIGPTMPAMRSPPRTRFCFRMVSLKKCRSIGFR